MTWSRHPGSSSWLHMTGRSGTHVSWVTWVLWMMRRKASDRRRCCRLWRRLARLHLGSQSVRHLSRSPNTVLGSSDTVLRVLLGRNVGSGKLVELGGGAFHAVGILPLSVGAVGHAVAAEARAA